MTRMPARTRRCHFEPPWRGDRFAGLQSAARRGYVYIDCNFQWFWHDPADHSKGGQAFCCHWGIPKRDNYRFIHDGRRVRPMTRDELRRPASEWPAHMVHHWRRKASLESERPRTILEMYQHAKALHLTIIPELKSPAFAHRKVAEHVVAAAREAGAHPWFMALLSMRECRGKCEAIERAGGEFAVIFGRRRIQRRPRDWSHWNPKPTRIWGPRYARRWLKED